MLTKNEAIRGLFGTAVDLCLVHKFQRLYNGVPIFLMFRDVMSKESEDRLIVSLGLVVGVQTVRLSVEVLNTKQGA